MGVGLGGVDQDSSLVDIATPGCRLPELFSLRYHRAILLSPNRIRRKSPTYDPDISCVTDATAPRAVHFSRRTGTLAACGRMHGIHDHLAGFTQIHTRGTKHVGQ